MYLSCSTVANRFVSEYGLVRLSIGEAMRRVLMEQPKTDLAKAITKHLIKGLTVPDELAVQALDICLMDMRCQTRGWVLKASLSQQSAEGNKIVFSVLWLKLKITQIL